MSTDTTTDRPWRDAETLRRLYIEEGLERADVAARLGCRKSTVDDWLTRHGIRRRADELYDWDADELRRLYHDEGLTQREIGEELGCSQGAVAEAMQRHDIETREVAYHYSESDLIDELRRVNGDCEYRVTTADMKADDDAPSPNIYNERFGGFADALEAADINPDAPTRPTSYRDSLERGQGGYLQRHLDVSRELLRADPPVRRRELDISDSAFRRCIVLGILTPATEMRTVDDAAERHYYSWEWSVADGVKTWIRNRVETGGECPDDDCDATGVRNLGDGEFTCTSDDCDSRFDRETAKEVLGR